MGPKLDYRTFILAGIRNKMGRNLAAAFCFALIAANIFSGQYLLAGTVGSVDQGANRMGADLIVIPLEYTLFLQGATWNNTMAIVTVLPSNYRFDRDILGDIRSVQGVERTSTQLFVSAVTIPELSSSPVNVYGIEPATDFTIRPWLREQRRDSLSRGEVLVGHEIRGDIGNTITLYGHSFTIAGQLDPTQSEIDHSMFLSMEDAYDLAAVEGVIQSGDPRIGSGEVNAVLVQIAPKEDREIVAFRLNRICSPVHIAVIGRHFSLDPVSQNLQGLPYFLNVISVIVVIAAFPLIALIAAMVAHERQREIGLLRAMGAKRSIIIFLVMAESLALASLGALVGVGASLGVLSLLEEKGVLNSALQVSFRMPMAVEVGVFAGLAFLVVIVMAGLSSIYPAYQCSIMNPLDAINSEGK